VHVIFVFSLTYDQKLEFEKYFTVISVILIKNLLILRFNNVRQRFIICNNKSIYDERKIDFKNNRVNDFI